MLIRLFNVLSQDGKEESLSIPVEMETYRFQGKEYRIAEKNPLNLHLLHKGNRVVELTGSTEMKIQLPCARCLEVVDVPFDLSFEYELDLKQTTEERETDLNETSFLEETNLDTEQLVSNEILVNWPIRVLCKEDCQGICSHCGVNLNHGTCDCDTSELDPRMAAIRDIFSKFKEV